MTQTKFLITGATGGTGGYTVRQLLEKNQAVRVLAHRSDERSEQLQLQRSPRAGHVNALLPGTSIRCPILWRE